jgi:hypothetical protein
LTCDLESEAQDVNRTADKGMKDNEQTLSRNKGKRFASGEIWLRVFSFSVLGLDRRDISRSSSPIVRFFVCGAIADRKQVSCPVT